jgi:hypothetical protein
MPPMPPMPPPQAQALAAVAAPVAASVLGGADSDGVAAAVLRW